MKFSMDKLNIKSDETEIKQDDNKKICIVYADNIHIDKHEMLCEILDKMRKHFLLFIVGKFVLFL